MPQTAKKFNSVKAELTDISMRYLLKASQAKFAYDATDPQRHGFSDYDFKCLYRYAQHCLDRSEKAAAAADAML